MERIRNNFAAWILTPAIVALLLVFAPRVWSQSDAAQPMVAAAEFKPFGSLPLQLLPDAPQPAPVAAAPLRSAGFNGAGFAGADPTLPAGRYQKYILPGQAAPQISAGDKAVMGVRDLFTVFTLESVVLSAGYSHVTNNIPNYGTNSRAFGQRVGAAAIRDASQSLFSDSILSGVLREDPRYYEMGRGHSVLRRVGYAVTRVLVTRTDHGHLTPNLSLLGGYAGSAALTNLYYPQLNRGWSQTMMGYGGSLGGAAFGFGVSEFSGELFGWMHGKSK